MAVKNINEASEGAAGIRRFTGLLGMTVLGVNLNKEQLNKIGMKTEKEQEYFSIEVDENNPKVKIAKLRLTFMLGKVIGEGDDAYTLLATHSVFLEKKYQYNKDKTKVQIIDKFGKHSYLGVPELKAKEIPYDWFDVASTEPSLVGQVDLVEFIRAMANSKETEELTLADLSPKGDINNLFTKTGHSEIASDISNIKKANGGIVKVLLGIRSSTDGKEYQDVFPYKIGRVYTKPEVFHKELVNLAKNSKSFFDNRYYGDIDTSNKIVNAEEYRLSEVESESSSTSSATPKKTNNAPEELEDEFAGEAGGGFGSEDLGSGVADDPFAL